tara:strand:- start:233 stop:373 length:141 start_codon:yes stop_codon:yes gene_type:complete
LQIPGIDPSGAPQLAQARMMEPDATAFFFFSLAMGEVVMNKVYKVK